MSEQNITPPPGGSELRDLLTQVAAGTVDPAEAARRMSHPDLASQPVPPDPAERADQPTPPGDQPPAQPYASGVRVLPPAPPAPPAPPPPPAPETEAPIDRIVIRVTAGKLVLLGDPTVTGATVVGPHVARRDGGALIIDTDDEPGPGDFAFEPTARRVGRMIGRWSGPDKVVVSMRPDLPVEVVVAAGSVVASGLVGGLRFTCDAGSIKASRCSGTVDGRVASGSATLDWLFEQGSSRLRCELGSVKVRLDPRSSVTVHARAELGSIDLGSKGQAAGAGAQRELVVGSGTATLDMDVSLGSIKLAVAER